MNDIIRTYQERFRRSRYALRRYTALLLALALITTLFVNWQLHGVGISMTADYQCGEVEHTHTASCYTRVLVCGYEEGELENPDQVAGYRPADTGSSDAAGDSGIALYDAQPQVEWVPHEHTADCYTEVQTLTCLEEEHVHTDDCFDPEDGRLICDKFEHTHDESCYTTEQELTCGLEEGELVEQVVEPTQSAALFEMATAQPVVTEEPVDIVEPVYHHHTDACYEEVLTCPFPEHHHTVNCLSDSYADVETEEEWLQKTDTTLDGLWADDLLTVAKSQLGYEQSERNFQLDGDDNVTVRHYTRYGQAYGNPYGEWDVMFLSYCLRYADIPQTAVPQEASVLALRSAMKGMEWLQDVDGTEAVPGDIVTYKKQATRTVAVERPTKQEETSVENSVADYGIATLPADAAAAKPVVVDDTALADATAPQTTTETRTVDTVGIVESIDEETGTLTVISGDVDGKVAEVQLAPAEVESVIGVTAAQLALSGNTGIAVQPGTDSTKAVTSYVDYFEETKTDQNGGITSAVVKKNGQEVLGDLTLTDGDEIALTYNYYIPAGVLDLAAGKDTLTYKLPTGALPSKKGVYNLKDDVGTLTIEQDGTVTLKFNNKFDPNKPFTGAFELNAKVKSDDIGDGGTIKFPGDKASIIVKNPTDLSIDKTGTYDEKDGERIIHYTVTVSSEEGWKDLVTIKDKLDNSGKVTGKYVQSTIKLVDKKGNPIDLTGKLTWNTTDTDQSFEIKDLLQMNAGDKYVLTYDVELSGNYDGNGSGNFHNTAWANDKQTDKWTWHSEYIKKEGKYNNEDGYMYWTVTLPNNNGGNLKGFKVTDKLQDTGATIVGDVTITEKDKSDPFDTITNVEGKSGFTYTFTKDATGKEYTFTYKTTVPDGATNVKNDSSVEPPDGGKYDASANPGVTDRSWDVSKSTSGSLTETETSNLYKAPWKISTPVPNKWETYKITDKIRSGNDDKLDHYGIAKDLQTEIENRLTFTLVDNTTMSYTEAVNAGIGIKITYYDNEDPTKSSAKTISADNTTEKVRSFTIELTKTETYTGKNIKQLTIDGYYTYADVTNAEPGEKVTIRNKANDKDSSYSYTKPKEPTDFEKGVSTSQAGDYENGSYSDKASTDYKEDGTYLYYQLNLDITEFTEKELADNKLIVTDQLPVGLKYVEGSTAILFRMQDGSIQPFLYSDSNSIYNDWMDAFGINKYDASNSRCFEATAGAYSATEGQELTFTFKGLNVLNHEKARFKGLTIRYQLEADPELWKAWHGTGVDEKDKDERTYINTAHWRGLEASATAIIKRRTDNLEKSVKQLKDSNGNKIGSAEYTVKINPGAKDLIPGADTVTLVDTLTVQKGFTAELDLDSVQLYDASDTTFSNPLPRTLYTFQYTSQVSADGADTHTMTLTVPDQRALVLKYTYETNAGINQTVQLDNHVTLASKWDTDGNAKLKDIEASGYVKQSLLVVHKVDSTNQANGLKDAKFALHWFDAANGTWKTSDQQHYTTDDKGIIKLYLGNEDLYVKPDVLYKLTEEVAPDGYRKSDADYYFIFPKEGQTDAEAYIAAVKDKIEDANGKALPKQDDPALQICMYGVQNDLYVTNERSQLLIQKFWANQYNEAMTPTEEEITVKLYKYPKGGSKTANSTLVETITLKSANDWKYTYDNLDPGYLYYIEEASTGKKYDVIYSDSNTNGVENGGLLTLTNKERADDGYELPSTGGTGTLPFTAVGGTMMLAALVYGVRRKRRHEGRAD